MKDKGGLSMSGVKELRLKMKAIRRCCKLVSDVLVYVRRRIL
jgi:hypothetical protein